MLRMRRWSTLPRALMVLCVWLGVLFSSEAHHYTVQHLVCPEHGELIDAPFGEVRDADSAPATPDQIVPASGADRFDGPHACDTPPLGPTLPAVFAVLAAGPTPVLAEAGLGAARAHAPVAAIHFAPKTSPPQG